MVPLYEGCSNWNAIPRIFKKDVLISKNQLPNSFKVFTFVSYAKFQPFDPIFKGIFIVFSRYTFETLEDGWT